MKAVIIGGYGATGSELTKQLLVQMKVLLFSTIK